MPIRTKSLDKVASVVRRRTNNICSYTEIEMDILQRLCSVVRTPFYCELTGPNQCRVKAVVGPPKKTPAGAL